MAAAIAAINGSSRSADARLSEKDFQRQVTDLAEILGWEWAHFRPAQTSKGWRTPVSGTIGEGWVDLVLVRPRDRRLVFAELKSANGELTPRQLEVLDVLRSVAYVPVSHRVEWGLPTIEVYVFHPADMDSGLVQEVLR